MPHRVACRLGRAGAVLSGPFPVVVAVGQAYCAANWRKFSILRAAGSLSIRWGLGDVAVNAARAPAMRQERNIMDKDNEQKFRALQEKSKGA
ncbi:hypothetical protein HHL21_09610 [Massilia sp. RP-1-19]|uniref:Uncharacterized protein n=1 Tax=Massilia polaris TaxID=2728846 RepID=A0A848HMG7_9BURK|nr:hypothetical protein [Massilia polaris]NML61329.1 hypothetical protein [Massilia polaris]